jgi:N-acetylmuramoyl-L-alanine amidase
MGLRSLLAPSLLLVALLPARVLAAELRPSATRISVAGKPQLYRSYGLAREGEVYAPIGPALAALGVEVSAEERHVLLRVGERTERWRAVEVPPSLSGGDQEITAPEGEEPRPLHVGEEWFLPVKAVAELAGHAAIWDEGARLLQLVPYVTHVEVTEAAGETQGAAPLRLRIVAGGPVRAESLTLRGPWRLVVDLSPAVLRLPDGMPMACGAVQTIRAGQFAPTTARIVIEAGRPLALTGLPATPARELSGALSPESEEKAVRSLRTAGRPQESVAPARPKGSRTRAGRPPRRLASRGGLVRRDPQLLQELQLNGEGVLAGRVICVDAGHGGADTGARGIDGLIEKEVCLEMAQELARALREVGAVVLMTREEDRTLTLSERIDFANSQGCDLFISIHCNSMPRPNMSSGTETYYCTAQSLDLAQAIHAAIAGFVAGRDGGVRQRRFAVVRRTTMPSVLVEVAYINHSGDAARLADPEFRRGVGDSIRDGVLAYYGN